MNHFKADRWDHSLPLQARCVSSSKHFELLLKQVTHGNSWMWPYFPACAWNKHSNVPWQSVRITSTLYLVIDNSRKTTWAMSTLKTGEVHKIFPLPNIPVLTHIWAATSLKLQGFFLHFTYSFYLKPFHILILLTDANTLQAVDQFVRLQWLA